jgi:hypothetical protein
MRSSVCNRTVQGGCAKNPKNQLTQAGHGQANGVSTRDHNELTFCVQRSATHQEDLMTTHDEQNAAHILTLLERAPGRQLSSAQLAEQTGWSPEELSAAVGILRSRQQVVLDDAGLGSGNYGFTSIMLP